MRENLARDYVDSIYLFGEFTIEKEVFLKEFSEYRDRTGGEYPIVFVDIYSRLKKKHSALLMMSLDEESNQCFIQINYEVDSVLPQPPKVIEKPGFALEKLSGLIDQIDFQVRANFTYDTTSHQAILPIPIKLRQDENSDFDAIWGLRLVKFNDNGSRKYSAIIDMPSTEAIILSINMPSTCKTDTKDFIISTLHEVIAVSNLFIKPN